MWRIVRLFILCGCGVAIWLHGSAIVGVAASKVVPGEIERTVNQAVQGLTIAGQALDGD